MVRLIEIYRADSPWWDRPIKVYHDTSSYESIWRFQGLYFMAYPSEWVRHVWHCKTNTTNLIHQITSNNIKQPQMLDTTESKGNTYHIIIIVYSYRIPSFSKRYDTWGFSSVFFKPFMDSSSKFVFFAILADLHHQDGSRQDWMTKSEIPQESFAVTWKAKKWCEDAKIYGRHPPYPQIYRYKTRIFWYDDNEVITAINMMFTTSTVGGISRGKNSP